MEERDKKKKRKTQTWKEGNAIHAGFKWNLNICLLGLNETRKFKFKYARINFCLIMHKLQRQQQRQH